MKDTTTVNHAVLEQQGSLTINTEKIESQTSIQVIKGSPLTDENHHLYEYFNLILI